MEDLDGFYIGLLLITLLSIGLLFLVYRKGKSIQPMKTLHIIGWNTLLLGVSIIVLFWGVESYYRFYVDTTDSFAISKITQRWGKRYYKNNNIKSRDNVDYILKKQPGLRRITFIGDSFTIGYGIEDVDDRFVNIIRKSLYDKEIHVIAGNGFDTDRQFLYLKQFHDDLGYDMDVVILVYNLNDIAFLIPENKAIVERIYGYEDELGYIGQNSYFVNEAFFKWKAMTDPDMGSYFGYLKDSYKKNTNWTNMQNYLGDVINYCNDNEIKLMVITFPFLHDFEREYQFVEAHQALAAFWAEKGIPHMDLLPAFLPHKDEYLIVNDFDAHPNEKAHQIAAKAIEKFILQNVKD